MQPCTPTDGSRAPAADARANGHSSPTNAQTDNQCTTLAAIDDGQGLEHDPGPHRDESPSSAKLGRRIVKPRKLFDPEPSISAHISAALLLNPGAVASELSAEVAARAFVEAPRPLPFVLPKRPPRPRPLLALKCNAPSASASRGSSSGGSTSLSLHEPVPKQLRDYLDPGQKESLSRSDGSRQARYGSGTAASSTDSASASELAAAAVETGEMIDAISEFSGIGALEHGLQAGMAEAGLKLRLLQASELDDTSEGRHNSSVLRKRFPHCTVLNPSQRRALPYPPSARLLTVTTLCRHHSKMNPTRSPWETEDLLGPVFERLRKAPGIETVVMENVPEFVQILDLQERSSYTLWVEGLEACGFEQHAYALLPTAAAGDLHGRTRCISVHTRACSFHPAAALSLLVDEDGDSEAPEAIKSGAKAPKSFAFVSGLSQNRFETNGGAIRTCVGRLPAYNSNLNVVIFWDGVYYQLSPWLASRASALPDAWQHVSGKGKRKHQNKAVQGSALANMVSPLQAREVGHAIATEWTAPRRFRDVDCLRNCTRLPQLFRGRMPDEFPCNHARASLRGGALLCFSHSTGLWHRIASCHRWRSLRPASTLDELCALAMKRKQLKPFMSVTDLRRAAEDRGFSAFHRKCAALQLTQAEEVAAEKAAARPEKPETPSEHTWMQCDLCMKWRRMPSGLAPMGDDDDDLASWTCAMLPIDCSAPEEKMSSDEAESWRHEHTYTSAHDRWLLEAADRLGATASAAIKRASLRESAFTFDHFFRSRTTTEIGERLKVLLQNSSATSDEMLYLEDLADAKAAADHEQHCAHDEAEAWLAFAQDAYAAAGLDLPAYDSSATDASGEGGDSAEKCDSAQAPSLEPAAADGGSPDEGDKRATPPPSRSTWLACDLCGQWRRVGLCRADELPEHWTCAQNSDAAFASCAVPQELSDDQIDVLLGLAPKPAPSDAATTGRRSRRKRGAVDDAASTLELEFEDEFDACGLQPRDRTFAAGLSPTGAKTWFVATVIDVNVSRWPPVTVRFDATLQGETHPLCLPGGRQTRLHNRDLASVIYAEGERLCLEDVVDPETGALRQRTVPVEDVSGGASSSSDGAPRKKARRSEMEPQEGGDEMLSDDGGGTDGPSSGRDSL